MQTKWVGSKIGKVVHEVRAETVRPWERDPHDRIAAHAGKDAEIVFGPNEIFDTYEEACKYAGVKYRSWTHWDFHQLRVGEPREIPSERRHAAHSAARQYKHRLAKHKEKWDFSISHRDDGSWVIIRTA